MIPLDSPLLVHGRQASPSPHASRAQPGGVDYHIPASSLMSLFRFAWNEAGYIILAGTMALMGASVASLLLPLVFSWLITTLAEIEAGRKNDAASRDSKSIVEGAASEKDVYNYLFMLIGAFLTSTALNVFKSVMFSYAGERVASRLRRRVFDSLIRLKIEFFDATQSGELQSRLSNDCAVVQAALATQIATAFWWLAQILVSYGVMLYVQLELSLIILFVVPFVVYGAKMYGDYVRTLSQAYQTFLGTAGDVADDSLHNVRAVRVFSRESFESKRYAAQILLAYKVGVRRSVANVIIGGIELVAYSVVCGLTYYATYLAVNNEKGMSSSALSSFLLYTVQFGLAVGSFAEVYAVLMNAVGASDRLFALLGAPHEEELVIEDETDDAKAREPKQTPSERGSRVLPLSRSANTTISADEPLTITFENVCFAYPSRPGNPILNGVNMELVPGAANALVAPSGEGKSTIFALIQRFYRPTSGNIYLNDVDINTMHPEDLRRLICVVSQDTAIFSSLTIAENIAYGCRRTNLSRNEISLAAREGGIADFIEALPDGYETIVGSSTLSVGERQRLAIARAFLSDAPLLLLDEYTSAQDAECEALILEAMDRLVYNTEEDGHGEARRKTTLVIAHRIQSVRRSARIFVLDRGVVAASGTHAELMQASNRVYSNLVNHQSWSGH